MRIRVGRKNPHNLYLQVGDQPSDEDDICLGLIIQPTVAHVLADAVNRSGAARPDDAPYLGPERVANAIAGDRS